MWGVNSVPETSQFSSSVPPSSPSQLPLWNITGFLWITVSLLQFAFLSPVLYLLVLCSSHPSSRIVTFTLTLSQILTGSWFIISSTCYYVASVWSIFCWNICSSTPTGNGFDLQSHIVQWISKMHKNSFVSPAKRLLTIDANWHKTEIVTEITGKINVTKYRHF